MDEHRDAPGGAGDPIERLVRLGGPRPAVTRARSERVRASVEREWSHVVRTRTRRRRITTTMAMMALAAMVLLVVQLSTGRGARPPAPGVTLATLSAATAPVALETLPLSGESTELRVGGAVTAGRTMRTDAGVFATLDLMGTTVRVREGSRLRLESALDIVLMQGAVYVETAQSHGDDSSVRVHTPVGVVRDVGTRFEVRMIDAHLRVRVREGEVIVSAGEARARAGRGMEISSTGQGLVTMPAPTFGEDWNWVSRTAPRFDIDGRTFADFLEWVSREGGYSVEFERGAREAAVAAVLHGSLNGLTPEEALDVVVPSTGLGHRIVGGRIVVTLR